MGYLNNKLSGIAAVLEDAMLEKMARNKKEDKALTRSRREANLANRKANKNVADVMRDLDANRGLNAIGDVTPHELARQVERTYGKEGLKLLQGNAQDVVQNPALMDDLVGKSSIWSNVLNDNAANALTASRSEAELLSGRLNDATSEIANLKAKLRNALSERSEMSLAQQDLAADLRFAQARMDDMKHHFYDYDRVVNRLNELHGQNGNLKGQLAQSLDDLANFKNLGRFANAAKWIKGNPKKSIGAAVLGGTGLLGSGVGGGYLLKDYLDSREEQ